MAMREQNDGMVSLDGTLSQLPILKAWTNSSAVYWVKPSYPATGMMFMVGNEAMDGWAAILSMTLHPKRGLWRVYVPGAAFGGRYETRYKIVSLDGEGAKHVEGEGILRVYAGKIADVTPQGEVSEVAFPDGEVRKVTVAEDSTGEPVFSIGDVVEGATAEARPIYAYNKATGFFYLVTPFIDEVGEPMLSVADKPSDDGFDCFVKDASGFYFRRIDCFEDETGEMALQTGGLTT
jgi:hypothetical protein